MHKNKQFVAALLLLIAAYAFDKVKGDACTDIGGTCMDWTINKCTAGYETGLCPGDFNIKCCKSCDQTCQSNENVWATSDSQCKAANGNCMINTNYCDGSYSTGKCGGPSDRQCCQSIAGCPRIISRAEWGARPPTSTSSIGNNLQYQFVHHSEGPYCDSQATCSSVVRGIQNYHMDNKGWDDIGYSYLIGGDGNVYEGRGWNVQGAHTSNYNSLGYGYCFIGSFMTSNPVAAAQDAYLQLAQCAVSLGKVVPNYKMYGHRQAGATNCPGDSLYALIQRWPNWSSGSPNF